MDNVLWMLGFAVGSVIGTVLGMALIEGLKWCEERWLIPWQERRFHEKFIAELRRQGDLK